VLVRRRSLQNKKDVYEKRSTIIDIQSENKISSGTGQQVPFFSIRFLAN